ncbi:MAG TPA: ABC transporter permease [Pyrinomonadaceae bacterium]
MGTLLQDIRYGFRMMWKRPGFTAIVVLTLGLGIGANTAIFTVVNAALLRGLPYEEPERLVHLFETTPQKNFGRREASYPDFLDWRQNQTFEGLAAYSGGGGFALAGADGSELVESGRVTANFFDVLGVRPALGRTFREGEDEAGAERVVVLSHGAWQRRFGGDAEVVGRTLTLSGESYTVVGVLPPQFQFAARGSAEMWAPWRPGEGQRTRRFMHWVNVVGRIKTGVSQEQARAELANIARRIETEHHESHAGTNIVLVPLQEQFVGQLKPLLLVLLGAVGFVLLIACTNVANLLLVRGAARQKEFAVRAALGAGRRRLVRQMLAESLLLALVGGALGLVLAQWGVDALVAAIPQQRLNSMPYLRGLGLDTGTLVFTAALSVGVSLLFGLAPAFQASKLDLNATLKEGGGKGAAGASRSRLRSALVVTEVALSLVLLVGAGLMLKSLSRLLEVDPGFDTKNLLTFRLALPATEYGDYDRVTNFHRQLLSRLEALPGVRGVATVGSMPILGGNTTRFYAAGQSVPAPGTETEANLRNISAGYFRVVGMPLVSGREFSERDTKDSPPAIVVNQTLAARVFPGEEAVGQRLVFTGDGGPPVEIVGVVGDERINGLDAAVTPVVYYPYLQDTPPSTGTVVLVRTSGDASAMAEVVRGETRALEPGALFFGARTMEGIIADSPATFMRRYPTLLIGVFAAVAFLLASVGIYGVVSYTVSQQTHEIGVRMALGAQTRDVLRLIVGRGMALALVGVGVGLVGAFALTRLMSSLLFGVSPTDPQTFAVVAALLVAVALAACLVPARRATRVDPMTALRYE